MHSSQRVTSPYTFGLQFAASDVDERVYGIASVTKCNSIMTKSLVLALDYVGQEHFRFVRAIRKIATLTPYPWKAIVV